MEIYMFSLTPAAAQQIQQSANASGAAELALRIAAKVDPDGSLQYGMGFDEPKDEDMRLDLGGIAVVIGGESQELLFDTVLDYVELNPGEFNFIFSEGSDSACATATDASSGCGSTGCGSGSCASKGRTH
jgi:iron-sulfur cluster assembly protein